MQKNSPDFPNISSLSKTFGYEESDIQAAINLLQEQNLVYDIDGNHYIHRDYYETLVDNITLIF